MDLPLSLRYFSAARGFARSDFRLSGIIVSTPRRGIGALHSDKSERAEIPKRQGLAKRDGGKIPIPTGVSKHRLLPSKKRD